MVSGSATCQVTYSSVGSHTIKVGYLGDDNYSASALSAPITQVVNQADTTTGLASSANPSVAGQQVTYTATVSVTAPGAGTPTGTVTFKDGAATITCEAGSAAFNGTTATCKATYATTTGSPHSITAVYNGDSNYTTSTSSALTQTINKAATTTALASSANPSVAGQQVTYTATVSVTAPGAGTPTGTVTFKDGAATITCEAGSAAFNGTTATCKATYATTTGSPHSITAVYNGDSNYTTSTSSALTQTINKAATTTALASSANPSVAGQQVTYTATVSVTAPGAGTPTGTVTFKDGAATITCEAGSAAFNGTTATCKATYATTTGSPHSITAVYNGDSNYTTSTSSALTQTINKAATTTALASSANPSVAGQQVTYTATVSVTAPGAGTPTGTVTFKDGAATITCEAGSAAFNGTTATCKATYATTTGSPHSITAVYNGDSNYTTSTSSALTQTINKAATTTALASSANPSVAGQQVTYTATVSVTAPGAGTPTGTVTFKDGAATITCEAGSAAFNGTTATCKATYATTTGSPHSITAVYNGDSNYTTSTSSALTQTINIFAGIDLTGVTPAGTTCVYTSITAVVCTLAGLSNGAVVSGNVRLVDSSFNPVTNTSGSAITVSLVLSGQASGLTPAGGTTTIAIGSPTTSPGFSFALSNGNNKSATLVATVTLNGATYTVTFNASS